MASHFLAPVCAAVFARAACCTYLAAPRPCPCKSLTSEVQDFESLLKTGRTLLRNPLYAPPCLRLNMSSVLTSNLGLSTHTCDLDHDVRTINNFRTTHTYANPLSHTDSPVLPVFYVYQSQRVKVHEYALTLRIFGSPLVHDTLFQHLETHANTHSHMCTLKF